MQIAFILVEPVLPENVGAAARALKTMGFRDLRLVNSEHHKAKQAQWLAHGSREILEQAQSYPDLDSAIADLDLVVGTTAKKRHQRNYIYSPQELKPLIANKGEACRVGILFGREDQGLANEEIARCDLLTSIPLAASYPSLNLGQAVMLYAWELNQLPGGEVPQQAEAAEAQLGALRYRVRQLLDSLQINRDAKEYRWVEERLGVLAERDIHFMHTLVNSLQRALPADTTQSGSDGTAGI
ncbi:tRNA/rRNA methyltransferase [Aestuariirhabdus litorea]|uniref:tRNA (cytidine/uridine-2'-O-)-methyltransferase TrmJ n=1 Tax=Aestuariirhabdus litorea TaxID=2528527 RepID=A0A3P3VNP4_9GAMM|nr:tRNA/rRNA methyltransferase [Aestuariirhabdus litorea]RRJ84325.1 tRNA/rRNA methyltransferase [Aestuariirhabdus litorea]RWW97548.1 tRNA/rRNA methyltransferase [Endozoicomonadaceae bacterium GTF-13]